MRLEVCRTAVVLAILFSVLGSFAASPPTKPEPAPAVRSGSISDALCGRESEQRVRAEALDRVDPRVLSEAWRKLKVADVDLWLIAPICLHATSTEAARFENRHGALGRLRSRVERACTTEFVEASLARFRGWKPRPDEWPTSSECPGCAALRLAAVRVVAVSASRWPERKQAKDIQIGSWLDTDAQREPLIAALCAVRPSPGARAEIERRFRYYSWTASGAKLLEIAALFEQPEVVTGCRDR